MLFIHYAHQESVVFITAILLPVVTCAFDHFIHLVHNGHQPCMFITATLFNTTPIVAGAFCASSARWIYKGLLEAPKRVHFRGPDAG